MLPKFKSVCFSEEKYIYFIFIHGLKKKTL